MDESRVFVAHSVGQALRVQVFQSNYRLAIQQEIHVVTVVPVLFNVLITNCGRWSIVNLHDAESRTVLI